MKPRPERRADAFALLGVTPEQVSEQPAITPILTRAKLGRFAVVEYLSASEDPDARKFLEAWNTLKHAQRQAVPLEAVALAADLTTTRLFELIAGAVFAQSRYESALLAAAAHPKIVARSIERALETPQVVKLEDGSEKVVPPLDGAADRKMLHQQAGFLPMPKTQIVSLPGVKSIDARTQTANIAVLPPMESSVKKMADRFGEKLLTGPDEPSEPPDYEDVGEGDEGDEGE